MFIAALCTIAKKRRQAKCLQMDECTHTHTHTQSRTVFSLEEEGNPVSCNNVDGP